MNLMSEEYKKAKALYVQGKSLTEIGSLLSVDRKKVSKLLKSDGIDIRQNNQKYSYNETFFDVIDNEEKSYWLGYLYADGNVDNFSKYELRLGCAYRDKDYIEIFKNIICKESILRECIVKLKGKEYPSVKATITNKRIVESLIDKGCVPRKSLLLTFPDERILPKELQNHFIRGYFDGDGNIYGNGSSKMFRLVGTGSFLGSVHSIFKDNIDNYTITKLQAKKDSKVLTLAKSGSNNIKSIYDYLYKDSTIYLQRKHDKFLEII